MNGLAAGLPSIVFGVMLVLCRVGAAVAVLPGIGEAEAPAMLRVGVALCLAILIYPDVDRHGVDVGVPAAELVRLIASEFATGLLLGWLARLVALALPVTGQLISLFTGLSSVIQPDASLGAQSSALARLFSLAAPTLLLVSGLYALPIQALANSYRLMPLGGGFAHGDGASAVVAATAGMFTLSLRLAAPFVVAGTVWQIALGFLSKFVPTLQAGSALIPGQVLGGMLLLALLIRAMLWQWGDAASRDLMSLPGLPSHG